MLYLEWDFEINYINYTYTFLLRFIIAILSSPSWERDSYFTKNDMVKTYKLLNKVHEWKWSGLVWMFTMEFSGERAVENVFA